MSDNVIVFGLLVIYKLMTLIVGFGFVYLGYRLFMADKTSASGDMQASADKYSLSIQGGAPGIFFSLFGTVLICISVFKGVEFKHNCPKQSSIFPIEKSKLEKLKVENPVHDSFLVPIEGVKGDVDAVPEKNIEIKGK